MPGVNFRKGGQIGLVLLLVLLLAVAVALFVRPASLFGARCMTPSDGKIFVGVTYGCAILPTTAESRDAIHWVVVDLSAPGIELYVTPLDRSALDQGWEYRLHWISDVMDSERLAVAINGTLFTSASTWRPRLPGDLANAVETAVSNHVVNHVWEHTYLLWFDDQLIPHLRPSKPPTANELRQAKWGIGGQGVGLHEGTVWAASDRRPDARTAIGIDQQRKLLFLAVADWTSPRLMLEKLAEIGAREGMLLDGGGSSMMEIGRGARGVSPGVLVGGWRPVATYFGVRARTIASPED